MSEPSVAIGSSAAAAAGSSSYPKFPVKPYRADGAFPIGGLLMLVSAMVIAGGVLGFIVHIVRQYFYLILLFPILIGFFMGAVGVRMVRMGRVRNLWVAGLAGFLGGAAAMTMMHHFDYESLQKEIDKAPQGMKALAQMSPEQRQTALAKSDLTSAERDMLEESMQALRVHNFLDYLNYRAHIGVQLKSARHSGGDGLNLGYYGTWIYWLIELLIVAAITLGMVSSSAAEPFCAPCDRWKESRPLGFLGGYVAAARDALGSGDLNAIAASRPGQIATQLKVTAACCGNCGEAGELDVKLQHVTLDKQGKIQEKDVVHVTYPASALPALETMFKPAVEMAGPATPTPPKTV